MDVLRLIDEEGYRLCDLDEKHEFAVRWLRYLLEDFEECFEYDQPCEYGIIGDLKDEIAKDVIAQVKEWLEIQIAEYQVSFAEESE